MLEPFALLFMTVNSFKRQSDQNFICQLGRPDRKVILPRGCYDVTAGMPGGGGAGERGQSECQPPASGFCSLPPPASAQYRRNVDSEGLGPSVWASPHTWEAHIVFKNKPKHSIF